MRTRPALIGTLVALLALTGCGSSGDKKSSASKPVPVLGSDARAEDAAATLGFPAFATKNTTRVGGADAVANAAGVARAVYPARRAGTRPDAVVVVDVGDWRSAISAAQLMSAPLRAPILFSRDGEMPEASAAALDDLEPRGSDQAGKAQVIRVGDKAAKPDGLEVADVAGTDFNAVAGAVDKLQTAAVGNPSDAVIVASSDRPGFAMPAAGLSARTGAPVLWTAKDSLPAATRTAISERQQPAIYVLGPDDVISGKVENELRKLGAVRRISAADPVRLAIAVARFADGRFGWNVVDPGHGLVFASAERPADAAAAAPLSASGKYGPLLLVTDAGALPRPLQNYLLDIQPGYDKDPVRGVYNHGWLLGDENAISVDVQARIDTLLEIQPVETTGA